MEVSVQVYTVCDLKHGCQNVCPVKLRCEPQRRHNTLPRVCAHCFVAYLNQFGSKQGLLMTVLQRSHCIRSINLSFRTLALEQKSI